MIYMLLESSRVNVKRLNKNIHNFSIRALTNAMITATSDERTEATVDTPGGDTIPSHLLCDEGQA